MFVEIYAKSAKSAFPLDYFSSGPTEEQFIYFTTRWHFWIVAEISL
jgi:hypothetical protein